MKNITRAASIARALGLSKVVDNPKLRQTLGVGTSVGSRAAAQKTKKPEPMPAPVATKVPKPKKKTTDLSTKVRSVFKIDGPLVSVVVPVYNVEQYVRGSVQSLLDQSYENIQVIIVDDGSTDNSPQICDELAQSDTRVKVIHKKNAGLGAARNTGVAEATGKYLTFIDSDDFVTSEGLRTMVETLEKTGSAFVVGSIERFDSVRSWTPKWVHEAHSKTRHRLKLEQLPQILYDVFAWNKLYNFEIWKEIVGAFPEGILYEDQEGTAALYTCGLPFDVLDDVVYRWRLRDDSSSITQNKTSVDDLNQRLEIVDRVWSALEGADPAIQDFWLAKLLSEDLYYYYREIPRASDEFASKLVSTFQKYGALASLNVIQQMPFDRRLMFATLRSGKLADFKTTLNYFVQNGAAWNISYDNQILLAAADIESELPALLSEEEHRVVPRESDLAIEVFDQKLRSNGDVVLRGAVASDDLPAELLSSVDLVIETASGQIVYRVAGSRAQDERLATQWTRIAQEPAQAIFDFSLNPKAISDALGTFLGSQSEELSMRFEAQGLGYVIRTKTPKLKNWFGLNTLVSGQVDQFGNTLAFKTSQETWKVYLLRPRFVLNELEPTKNSLRVKIQSYDHTEAALFGRKANDEPRLYALSKDNQDLLFDVPLVEENGELCASVQFKSFVPSGVKNFNEYDLRIRWDRGRTFPVGVRNRTALTVSAPGIEVLASDWGYLSVRRYVQFAVIDETKLQIEDSTILVRGRVYFDDLAIRQFVPTFALVSSTRNIRPEDVHFEPDSGTFQVKFSMLEVDQSGRLVSLPSADYIFQILQPTGKSLPASIWPKVLDTKFGAFYREATGNVNRLRLYATPGGKGLKIRISSPLAKHELGKNNQYKLQQSSLAGNTPVDPTIALFESFAGSSKGDSPAAFASAFAELKPEVNRYWTIKDGSVSAPDGCIPVVRYSEEWWNLLHSAGWLINNNNFPSQFRKQDGQTYIQTWHGTPLKKIGHHVPQENLSLGYRMLMEREERYWDFFLAQSEWAGKIMRDAFRYTGTVVSDGYPRNDGLVGETALECRAATREYLSITDEQTVVLYAPTWRDDKKVASGHYDLVSYLDFDKLRNKFGDDVVILMRGHSNTTDAGRQIRGINVIDVSRYSDISDLINASDLLVTDYSSIMFDYVVTRKPMIFLVPDIEQYSGTTRGFYFDFKEFAPGPLCRTTDEVISYIEKFRSVGLAITPKYEAFLNRFASQDDGHRAVEMLRTIFAAVDNHESIEEVK
ncbi:CDP-glycerol:glycerophosphate glycerophosphotransferase [Corynebacterium sp. DNF00584]|uniref:CDP-glycerol:glycerophosphate glycerophosphotransferase n=1 Tax=Corynebacterium sp. DNF00584 TaxID=1384076 RepID=UPI0009E73CD2|nr:CDP-glycerol glycerophosphotransferase family protein [Corynebacterium sp. DNF00584]